MQHRIESTETTLAAVHASLLSVQGLPGTANEATTRMVVIDAVLTALGWSHADLSWEAPTGTGDFLDYVLKVDGRPWMIVEAKRKGVAFHIDPQPSQGGHRPRSIQSFTTRGGQPLKDATAQAARYCNDTGTALACVTNGGQWLFYRGLAHDGKSWLAGNAFVFLGPDEVLARFDEFCLCLARASSGSPWLLERLDGPVPLPTLAPTRPIDRLGRIGARSAAGEMAVSDAYEFFAARFLREIHVPDGVLTARDRMENCYVPVGTPGQLDKTLASMIAEDEQETLPDVEVAAEDAEKFGARLHRYHRDQLSRDPVVVIGNTGAGKSTYIHRALSLVRARDEGAFVAIVDLTGLGDRTTPDHATTQRRIAEEVLVELWKCVAVTLKDKIRDEKTAAPLDPNSFEAFRAMRDSQIRSESASYEQIHGPDSPAWRAKLQDMFEQFRASPIEHCFSYVTHLGERYPYRLSKRSTPVKRPVIIVLDNVDLESPECQRAAYSFAERLAKKGRAIVVVTMREETYEEARVGRGFLSGVSLRHVHHVVAPAFDALLSARLRFARRRVDQLASGGVVGAHSVEHLSSALEWLGTALAPKSPAQGLVAGATGSNMRAALEVASEGLLGSASALSQADGTVEHLLDCLFARRSVHATEHLFAAVVNCFQPELADRPLHALATRLLAYFMWSREPPALRATRELAETVVGQFCAWGYPASLVRTALDRLAGGRLLAKSLLSSGQVRYRLTASGHVHVDLLLRNERYRLAMAVLTDWYDTEAVNRFVARAQSAGGSRGLSIGDLVEARALDVFDEYLTRQIAAENRLLSESFRADWKMAVASAASVVASAPVAVAADSQAVPNASVPPVVRKGNRTATQSQLELGIEVSDEPNESRVALGRLPSPLPGDVPLYAARILWALEYARLAKLGPQRASDLADLFTKHGGHVIHNTNVARAFRQFKESGLGAEWWRCELRRYAITPGGSAKLKEVLSHALTQPFATQSPTPSAAESVA